MRPGSAIGKPSEQIEPIGVGLVVTHPASAGTIISLSALPLVRVDDDDNVISFELSPKRPLWKQPLFIASVVLLVLMIVAAIVGQS